MLQQDNMIFNQAAENICGIDIYIRDTPAFLAESYLALFGHNNNVATKIGEIANYGPARSAYFDTLAGALVHNYRNIDELLDELFQFLDLEEIIKCNKPVIDISQLVLKDYHYLKRDWSGSESGEHQVRIITGQLGKYIRPLNLKNALFLGCGAGRIAAELAHVFDYVYATDKSFSMLWHLNRLMAGRFEFYIPQFKNIYALANAAGRCEANIPDHTRQLIKEKCYFFISDVLDMPLTDRSMDCILSVYFSDVIALKLWFGEVDRLLAANGLFVHFGPLDYFFSDPREMLTAEEFRAFFERSGYITICDELIETPHLKDDNSLSSRNYVNWCFICQKQ